MRMPHPSESIAPSEVQSAGEDVMEDLDPTRNPIGTELVYEDEAVRVWRIELEPGAEAPWHTHRLDYTTVVIEGGTVERPNADGTVDRFELNRGDVMRGRDGSVRHMVRNVGETRFENVIVEIKGTVLVVEG
jgi:quercetin dioxygenase-like cupin family protein